MDNTNTKGHILAVITVLIWGTTFISTKTLLHEFTPVEILFFRFIMGLILLTAAYPKMLHTGSRKREGVFALAGLTGVIHDRSRRSVFCSKSRGTERIHRYRIRSPHIMHQSQRMSDFV